MEIKKTNYGSSNSSTGASKTDLRRLGAVFKNEKGAGYDVKVSEELVAALSSVAVGDFLKIYEHTSAKGVNYLSLSIKPGMKKSNS